LQPAAEFTRPTEADIDELVRCMRPQDVAECHAAGHTDLHAVIRDGVARSTWCHAVRIDGKLLAIFGVAPLGTVLDPRGVPWLLGTPELPRCRRALGRHAPAYIASMLASYPHLLNHVHAENTVAVRWLRRMGFTLHAATPHPVTGAPFQLFEMRA
jgi:hypothetical protein